MKTQPVSVLVRERTARVLVTLALFGLCWPLATPHASAAAITLSINPQTNGFGLSWNSATGSLYKLQTTTNLLSGAWDTLAPLYANSDSLQWTDFNPPDKARFYRVTAPNLQIARIEPAIVVAYSGSQMYITGYGLDANTTVLVGGSPLSGPTFISPNLLQGGVPNLAPGYYDVQLFDDGGHLASVLTNALQIVADAASPALRVEPPGPTPGDPSGSSCSRGAQNDASGLFLFSGEVRSTATDLMIPGVGMDFVWSRCYRSLLGTNTSQGNGWTFGYNINIQMSGPDVLLTDGNSRHDLYFHQPDGTYSRDGFMREGRFDTNGNFILKFPDTGTWTFYPLDGSASQGKISAIQDRNLNAMRFYYDFSGRLLNVPDTLGRTNTLGYDGNGFLASVTDFSGRQITYAYYQNGDAGGSFGDLKSVTGPAVTGTPNGNDFPSGKTTTYTYTTGNGDDRLNHKLLTITDPKGQTWLQNTYSTTTDPNALDYGRVVQRTVGGTNDILGLFYMVWSPYRSNHFATQRTIVNDRVGNVKEYFYDSQNRLVIQRDYTGRAIAGQPSTDSLNRPTGKLRPSDPDYFETSYDYNSDSLPTRITYPNGNVTEKYYQSDFDAGAPPRLRGNLRLERALPGPLGGDQSERVTQLEYDTDLGGCCGFNFVTKSTDAQGNMTLHTYDSRGNRIHTVHAIPSITEDFQYNSLGQMTSHVWPDNGSKRRLDSSLFYTNGPQSGYLQQSVIDATNLALTTSYEHDARGNVTRKIDARGHASANIVNELDQVVRQLSREVTNIYASWTNQIDTAYDGNDNVVQTDVLNLDDQGVPQANAYFTTTTAYDILNYPTNITQEVDVTHNVVTEYEYDGNRNRTLVRQGQATSGADPFNTSTTRYDERGLPYQDIRAQGSTDQSTTQYDYDSNGNLIRTSQGLEDIAAPRITTYAFDGYNRRTAVTDAMGNVTATRYDADGNAISSRLDGELIDLPGGTNNVRLAETTYTYDALNRLVQSDQAFFDTATGTNIAGGHAITRTIYNANSQVLQSIDANNHALTIAYDSANRRSIVTDAKGNTESYTYDRNNNVVLLIEVDHSDLGTPAQTFHTSYAYDGLDRRVQRVDSLGNASQFGYDSRNNQVTLTDPRGNFTRYDYDGLNRGTGRTRFITSSGDGSGAVIGYITNLQTWDDSSRLTGQTDANTNTTAYVYDSLDRLTLTVFADGTTNGAVYDVHDNATIASDANGNVINTTYDLLNRATAKTIAQGAGVSGTTFENYQYDGLSRTVLAQNDDSRVTRSYDSLSHTVHETQQVVSSGAPVRTVACTYDGVGNTLSCTYPGGRVVNCTYDNLNRQQTNSDLSGTIAIYKYFGATRVERRDYGNGTRAAYSYDPIRRMTNSGQTVISGGAPIDSRAYAWDAANNQTVVNDLLAPTLDARSFAYDSVNRLVQSDTAVAGPTISYNLDRVGNRLNVTGGTNAGSYFMNPAVPPADFQMNQYTTTPFGTCTNDPNGNLVSVGVQDFFAYDYRNRLLEAFRFNGAAYDHTSAKYDCFGRRIEESVASSVTRYYYAGWREIEEQDGTDGTAATYVWGNGIDELLSMSRGAQKYFYHADNLDSIRKVTDASHNIVEQYSYDDYGTPSFFNGSGLALAGTQIGNSTLFTGRRYDPETGLYYYRSRYLDPRAGRFTTRDTIGLWGDQNELGNAYAYVGNRPTSAADPTGLMITGGGRDLPPVCVQLYNECEDAIYDASSVYYKKDRSMPELGLAKYMVKTCESFLSDCANNFANDYVNYPHPKFVWYGGDVVPRSLPLYHVINAGSSGGGDEGGPGPGNGRNPPDGEPCEPDLLWYMEHGWDTYRDWGSASVENPCSVGGTLARGPSKTGGANPGAQNAGLAFHGNPHVPVLPFAASITTPNSIGLWRGPAAPGYAPIAVSDTAKPGSSAGTRPTKTTRKEF